MSRMVMTGRRYPRGVGALIHSWVNWFILVILGRVQNEPFWVSESRFIQESPTLWHAPRTIENHLLSG